MEISDQDTHLALIAPTVDLKEPVCISMGCLLRTERWSIMGVLAQGMGGEETSILSSVM